MPSLRPLPSLLTAFALLALGPLAAKAQPAAPPTPPPAAPPAQAELPLTVSEAWARPAARGGSGVVYLTLTNHGGTAERLIRAKTPVAGMAMLHETRMAAGGVMRMRDVAGIDIPAGRSVTLAPGGLHIMLSGLEEDLKPGRTFPLTLTFASGRELTLLVPVRGQKASGPSHEMSHDMPGMGGMNGH